MVLVDTSFVLQTLQEEEWISQQDRKIQAAVMIWKHLHLNDQLNIIWAIDKFDIWWKDWAQRWIVNSSKEDQQRTVECAIENFVSW